MINKTLKLFGLFLMAAIILFLLLAFANWQINPANWDSFARVCFSVIMILVVIIISINNAD